MRGDLTQLILETIKEGSIETLNLFSALLEAGYGASLGKFERIAKRQKILLPKPSHLQQKEVKLRYHKLLFALKRDGLIKKESQGKKKFLFLTKKGREKLASIKKRVALSLPKKIYSKKESKGIVIVVFDVPEKERRKRDWLRGALRSLGLKMIQKSVWMGKAKIPKAFLDDLYLAKITPYVEIFEVSKRGSLEHIV